MGGILIAILLAGCGGAQASPSSSPNRATNAPASPRPSEKPSPTASPSPTLSPAPTDAPPASPPPRPTDELATRFPWLPAIDSTVTPAFRVDEFVTSAVDAAPISAAPGGPAYSGMGYPKGGTLIVLHGPVVVDGRQWYLLTPAQLAIDIPTGWAPTASPDGAAWLGPTALRCPESPLQAESLEPLTITDGLPGCYGSDVTVTGDLTCSQTPDEWAVGAAWLAGGTCHLAGTHFTIYGLDPGMAPGRYAVTGHFDDPAAAECRDALGGTSEIDRIVAVLHCRRGLVATDAIAVQ